MQRIDTCEKTYLAGEALECDRLVKYTSAGTVVYADAGDDWIGATTMAVASGDYVAVRLRNKMGTIELVAAGTIAKGGSVYTAADGKISATPYGPRVGIAHAAATAGAVIEVLLTAGNENVVAFVAGEALAANRLVKVHTDGTLLYADADHKAIGYTLAAADSAATVYVALFGPVVTLTVAAATPAGADLYTAADGKVDDTATDFFVGISLALTANANDPVQVVLMPSVEVQP